MIKKLVRYIPIVFISLTTIFLLSNVLMVSGLHDWWPTLLDHWSKVDDAKLYTDVHYYSGPIYPFLLKIIESISSANFAPPILGVFLALFLVLSASAMLNSYAVAMGFNSRSGYVFTLVYAFAIILLIPARYLAPYLIVADYHTFSLILFCLAVNKSLVLESGCNLNNVNFSRASLGFSKIPIYFIAALLFLNRTHEGVLFLLVYPIYIVLDSGWRRWGWVSLVLDVFKFYFLALISILVLYYLMSLLVGLPSFNSFIKYVFITAPEAKGANESGYVIGILSNYFKTYSRTVYQIVGLSFLVIAARVFYKVLESDKITKKLLDITLLITVVIGAVSLIVKGKANGYLIDSNNLFLLFLFASFLFSLMAKTTRPKLNYAYVLVLPLIGGHIASTSGVYNESFILFLLPAAALNFHLLFPKIVISRKLLNYALIFISAIIICTFSYKIHNPRLWWLDNQPSIFSKREWTLGSEFEKRHPNLKPSLTYASSDFLDLIDGYCADMAKVSGDVKALSYPLAYFESRCITKGGLTSISNHFSLWYDVALLSHIEELRGLLENTENTEKGPDFLFLQLNPQSLFASAKYYWVGSSYNNYPHFKFFNLLQNYGDEKMILIRSSYLVNGKIIKDSNVFHELEGLREKGCFNLSNFEDHCESDFIKAVGSADVTLIAMYKK